ncbi:MAG TPA: hypothetical protein PLD47_15490 [Aggregatilineales bacterium]|nr:hypothetical protein [Anaerolineales bacterium]HRE49131.1 hypothetical protein [Aggregatilineales bacterium]
MSAKNTSTPIDPNFMELVQYHERVWGMEQYPQRPTMAELFQKPIVIMWAESSPTKTNPARTTLSAAQKLASGEMVDRFMFSCHESENDLNSLLLGMIMANAKTSPLMSNRRIAKIYWKQKEVKVRNLRLVIDKLDSE